MPFTATNPYCSLADVHAALRIATSDTADDDRIQLCLDAAARQIEDYTGRRFYLDSGVSARVYVPDNDVLVDVDDFQTTTGLIVKTDPAGDGSFGETWTSTDYQLEPVNGLVDGVPHPYTAIRAVRARLFPVYAAAYGGDRQALVQVTAKWGWTAIPTRVQKAAVVQTVALFKADDVPFGATPFSETGVIRVRPELHPSAAALLEKLRTNTVWIG